MTTRDRSDDVLTPAEMATATGVSLDTLRYYEDEGLLTDIERGSNGHRRYRGADVTWVATLRCLRDTGMTIQQLRRYCQLGEVGDATKSERQAILLQHRLEVEQQIAYRHRALELIDHKLSYYSEST